ncbi:MAG TPA: 16S rRNA (cytidine(1402)-2'-O)-methyltransferase [Bacteroidia bacterium]|nr:16S rRNA (cytidine(1402)-2'-O)-methyltransferase [Bacteroidia bacterium]MBP7713880.1 16S rRNA (cytidine(1402)-2'-O)-methyltransferase [Bacteroidia bacterium]MBP8668168.1 16S rRNA (cytidine(1402)-2'-O)-methyltransferase [Bacteroidia bacterium]HOZ83263.1 16S rRNA (cytidine(1402)-2'-O)-methyltransferase [Bacteroidia bacterium]HOZ90415.1 16S rRNA (cytidine(1402)-2'-O)-methyltransferase [Bacteroidia bacterium]
MLYIVPTPVGNLEDITLRALNILKSCDIILVEDTRNASVLLNHFGISKKVFTHHQHNEHAAVNELIRLLKDEKKTIALISDAGTPGISDPGFLLTRACIEHEIELTCLPGATAFVPALVMSGIPCNSFVFEGFLPAKKGRQTRLKLLQEETRTMVFYESPHKLIKSLHDFITNFGADRKVCVVREISKMFEEKKRGTLAEVCEYYTNHPPKGEIVIVVAGKEE